MRLHEKALKLDAKKQRKRFKCRTKCAVNARNHENDGGIEKRQTVIMIAIMGI